MYIIIKHSFDSLENEIGNARLENIVGYTENEIEADKWIEVKMTNTKQTKQWDGKMYPFYTKHLIKKLV